jgi:hypothetical protein
LSAKGVVLIQLEVCYQTTLFCYPAEKTSIINQFQAIEPLPAAFLTPTEFPVT